MPVKDTSADSPRPFVGDLDNKDKVEHEENGFQEEHVALKSEFDNSTAWQALKTFRVVSLYCVAAAFSAATDGYQGSRILLNTAGIVAHPGGCRSTSTATFWPIKALSANLARLPMRPALKFLMPLGVSHKLASPVTILTEVPCYVYSLFLECNPVCWPDHRDDNNAFSQRSIRAESRDVYSLVSSGLGGCPKNNTARLP